MKFEIKETLGDQTASLLYLVKYYNANEPENSGFDFFTAINDDHLKDLVAAELKVKFEAQEWQSTDADSLDLDMSDFSAHFDNDWDNWIKFHKVGSRISNKKRE